MKNSTAWELVKWWIKRKFWRKGGEVLRDGLNFYYLNGEPGWCLIIPLFLSIYDEYDDMFRYGWTTGFRDLKLCIWNKGIGLEWQPVEPGDFTMFRSYKDYVEGRRASG